MVKSKINIFFLIISLIGFNISCKNEIAQISQEIETKKYYTISFDSDGGSHIDSQSIEEGKTATKPNNPIKTNFSFDGWYIENVLFDFSTPITADLTLKAKWKPLPDTTPPGKVENLSGNSGNGSVLLSWKNPSDTDFYKVEIIFTPAVQEITQPIIVQGTPGSTSSKLIEGLSNGINYTFTLVAVDKENNKSQGVSISVKPTEPADVTPPAEIINLSTTGKHNKVILTWTNPADSDFCSVEISATPAEGSLTQPVIITCSPSTQGNYTAYNLQNGTEYTFTIKTIDSSNNKSNGTSTTGTPVESTLSLSAILPNDNGTIVLTNDSAPIKVSFSSTTPITRFVWKKGNENETPSAEMLLNDTTAVSISLVSPATIYVTENGLYDIAVQNEDEVAVWKRVEVKTIDKTPPEEANNITVSCDNKKNIKLSWENPISNNEYDSTLEKVIISYVYNDNESDPDNDCIEQSSGTTNWSYALPNTKGENDYIKIKIQTVDFLGNKSVGVIKKKWCCSYIKGTLEEVSEEIINMKSNGKVALVGDCNFSEVRNTLKQLKQKSSAREVDLDLSSVINLTSIPMSAFSNCTNLRSIIIPEGVTTLGAEAFSYCSNLTSITIPVSLTSIEQRTEYGTGVVKDAFYECENLERVNYLGTINQWLEKSLDAGKLPSGYDLYIDNTKVTDLIIPPTINNFGKKIFNGCKSLENVTFSNTTNIEYGAFGGCGGSNLHINYLGTLSEWCNGASGRGFGPYYLSINGQEQIDIQIPSDVNIIKEWAFSGCKSLQKLKVSENTKTIEEYAFSGCPNLTEVILCEGIENLGNYSFNGSALTAITIPGSIKKIGENAFYYCENLQEVIISEEVEEIGYEAFYFCKNLTNVTISEGVKTIGKRAFNCCAKLANITIPASVNYIETGAFLGCSGTQIMEPDLNIDFTDKTHLWRFGKDFESSGPTQISWDELASCLINPSWANENYSWKRE